MTKRDFTKNEIERFGETDTLELIYPSDIEENFNLFLDELGTVKIGSLEYATSSTLKAIDPIAYNEGLHNYMSAEDLENITIHEMDVTPEHYYLSTNDFDNLNNFLTGGAKQ